MKFRKKPIEIEAMQFTDEDKNRVFNWITGNRYPDWEGDQEIIRIETLEGTMIARKGDWIIKEPFPTSDRQFYPCKADIFEATYEAVE